MTNWRLCWPDEISSKIDKHHNRDSCHDSDGIKTMIHLSSFTAILFFFFLKQGPTRESVTPALYLKRQFNIQLWGIVFSVFIYFISFSSMDILHFSCWMCALLLCHIISPIWREIFLYDNSCLKKKRKNNSRLNCSLVSMNLQFQPNTVYLTMFTFLPH